MRYFLLFAASAMACGCVSPPPIAMRQYIVLDAGVQPFTPLKEEPYRWLSAKGELINKGLADEMGRAFVEPYKNETAYMIDLMWGRFRMHVPRDCWKVDPSLFAKCAETVEQVNGCSMFECKGQDIQNPK